MEGEAREVKLLYVSGREAVKSSQSKETLGTRLLPQDTNANVKSKTLRDFRNKYANSMSDGRDNSGSTAYSKYQFVFNILMSTMLPLPL